MVLQRITDVYKLWHTYLPHLPRLSRHTIGAKIDTLFTNLITHLLRAGYANRTIKEEIVQNASITLDELKYFLQLAWEMKIITHQKFIALSPPLIEVGKMIGAWLKQYTKETPAQARENEENS